MKQAEYVPTALWGRKTFIKFCCIVMQCHVAVPFLRWNGANRTESERKTSHFPVMCQCLPLEISPVAPHSLVLVTESKEIPQRWRSIEPALRYCDVAATAARATYVLYQNILHHPPHFAAASHIKITSWSPRSLDRVWEESGGSILMLYCH